MDDDVAKAYGRIMLLEVIFQRLLVGIYGLGGDPIKGIALLEAQKAQTLESISDIVIKEFDRDAARVAEEAMKVRAEEIFDEAIAMIRKERGLPSELNPPSGGTPSQGGGKKH